MISVSALLWWLCKMVYVFYVLAIFLCFFVPGDLVDTDADNATCHHGDEVYGLGSQWTLPGYCRLFLCEENSQIVEERCRDYDLQEGCYMSEYDYSLDYPSCCPRLLCHDQDSVVPKDTAVLEDWVDQ